MGQQLGQLGLAGQEATQADVDVLHAALLPGGSGVTEEGLDAPVVQLLMAGELGTIVEGDRLTPLLGEREPGIG